MVPKRVVEMSLAEYIQKIEQENPVDAESEEKETHPGYLPARRSSGKRRPVAPDPPELPRAPSSRCAGERSCPLSPKRRRSSSSERRRQSRRFQIKIHEEHSLSLVCKMLGKNCAVVLRPTPPLYRKEGETLRFRPVRATGAADHSFPMTVRSIR